MESNSSVDRLIGNLSRTSVSSSGSNGNDWSKIAKGWRSPASSVIPSGSPSSDLVIHHREHTRQQHRSLAESNDGCFVQGEGSGLVDGEKTEGRPAMSREEREAIRFSMVERKKDFKHMERVNGKLINVMEGLELHKGVFSAEEQKKIVNCVYDFQEKGRKNQLRERTYSEPRKWMRGKGRVTIQFGCCYNYATDKNGNPPGIIRDEEVDPIPPLLKLMIKRMVAWHVLPPTSIPNSCIVNIYEKDDCIPPHIDHHDFVRPFCTVSFLTECNILFGAELKILGPGEFSGSAAIPLPLGSVLILKGNGADVSKHCVPAVPAKRISITFRKMDDSKLPFKFIPDPVLQNLRPLAYPPKGGSVPVQRAVTRGLVMPLQASAPSRIHQVSSYLKSENSGHQNREEQKNKLNATGEGSVSPFQLGQDEFPPLCSSSVDTGMRKPRRSLRQ